MLLDALDNNEIVEVEFLTKKGTHRIMHCTRVLSSIQEADQDGINNPKYNGPQIVAVYDWLNFGWRAFRWDSVITWSII